MEFSQLVRIVRNQLDLSQEQLARNLNISFSTVNRWENGKTVPIPMAKEAFLQFCQKHNIDIDEITRREE